MQTQKDKVAVDISQIPQDALKSYDNWRFGKNLFIGLSATFIVLLFFFFDRSFAPIITFFICGGVWHVCCVNTLFVKLA